MRIRSLILLGVVLILCGAAVVPYLVHRAVRSRIGPEHVYELSGKPPFLTEDMALAKARDTLAQDGVDAAAWRPVPGGPSGQFASRNTINSNEVVLMFTNGTGSGRFVSVRLDGTRVVCQSSIEK